MVRIQQAAISVPICASIQALMNNKAMTRLMTAAAPVPNITATCARARRFSSQMRSSSCGSVRPSSIRSSIRSIRLAIQIMRLTRTFMIAPIAASRKAGARLKDTICCTRGVLAVRSRMSDATGTAEVSRSEIMTMRKGSSRF